QPSCQVSPMHSQGAQKIGERGTSLPVSWQGSAGAPEKPAAADQRSKAVAVGALETFARPGCIPIRRSASWSSIHTCGAADLSPPSYIVVGSACGQMITTAP